jgi:oligopeptide/dipeptide ABC transporter ATP-binding protein
MQSIPASGRSADDEAEVTSAAGFDPQARRSTPTTGARHGAHLRGIDLDIGKSRILGVVGESGSVQIEPSRRASCASCPRTWRASAGEICSTASTCSRSTRRAMNAYRGTRIAMIFQDPMTALNPLYHRRHALSQDVLRRRHPGLPRDGRGAMRDRGTWERGHCRLAPAPRPPIPQPSSPAALRQRVMIAMRCSSSPISCSATSRRRRSDATVEAQIVAAPGGAATQLLRGSIVFISHHLGPRRPAVRRSLRHVGRHHRRVRARSAEVLGAPRHPYTQALLACELDDEDAGGRLKSIPGEVPDPVEVRNACVFAPRCRYAKEVCLEGVPGAARSRARAGARRACAGRKSRFDVVEESA